MPLFVLEATDGEGAFVEAAFSHPTLHRPCRVSGAGNRKFRFEGVARSSEFDIRGHQRSQGGCGGHDVVQSGMDWV